MNTNGMRVPMTARKNISFKGTLIRAGKVFDAGHPDNARQLYKAGDAVHGDASGDLSILAMQEPEAVATRPVFTPPQRTVAMVRTVNPEAPVAQVATDKSPEPIAPEGAAPVAVTTEATTETATADAATADTATTETGASDAAAETAAAPAVKAADKVEEPVKQPETPVVAAAAPSVKKVAARKR